MTAAHDLAGLKERLAPAQVISMLMGSTWSGAEVQDLLLMSSIYMAFTWCLLGAFSLHAVRLISVLGRSFISPHSGPLFFLYPLDFPVKCLALTNEATAAIAIN
jgi:hypothetical protein